MQYYSALKKHIVHNVFKFILIVILICIAIEYNYSMFRSIVYMKEDIYANITNRTRPDDDYGFNATYMPPKGYLVYNDHCRMPDVYPFTVDVMLIFSKKIYSPCSPDRPLIKVVSDINSRTYSLYFDEDAKRALIGNDDDISCCYNRIVRSGTGERIDKDYKLENCVNFSQGVVIPPHIDGLIIKCESVKLQKEVQKDAFYFVREKPEVRGKLRFFRSRVDRERPASVLLMGIDSMSRFNFRRTMPQTAAQILNKGWFELSGYNKIDDNTFPNLMALLSGQNSTTAWNKCDLKNPGGLNNCSLIWDIFNKSGYVTGYAEDETWMSTFDYVVKGFINPPVDYYHRPFMLAVEDTLEIKKQSGMRFCVGLRHGAEYLYDFGVNFATRFKGEPYFGLFWSNTFTHNSFDDASAMDFRIAQYIKQMRENEILEDSIVMLFSDHGSRFGKLRRLRQGFLEERLPMFFIWLPSWFKSKHPEFVEALKINKYRLTNPYDIHMTLKHILELSGRNSNLSQAVDCPKCQSLFYPVPFQRSCKDIAIDDHWCTCIPYENVDMSNTIIKEMVKSVVHSINSDLTYGNFSPPCQQMEVKSIDEAQIRVTLDTESDANADDETYRVRFTVDGNNVEGKFEASILRIKASNTYRIIDSVSRLDSYKEKSWCTDDSAAKKYCICDKFDDKSSTNSSQT